MSKKPTQLSDRRLRVIGHLELRNAFDIFDRDKSGSISISELKHVLTALNFKPSDQLLRKIMAAMDADGSGSVDFDEFVRVMADIYSRDYTEEEMRRAFDCYDADKSGYITSDELHAVLHRLDQGISSERIQGAFRQIDVNHDGKISFDEFVRLIKYL